MSQIENQLYKIHAEAREQKQEVESRTSFTEQAEPVVRKPFAKIDRVDPTSPSETAVRYYIFIKRFGFGLMF